MGLKWEEVSRVPARLLNAAAPRQDTDAHTNHAVLYRVKVYMQCAP